MIATTKYCYSYTDRDNNVRVYVLNAQESDKRNCPIFDEYINGLYIGNAISKPMLFNLMDNGYEWTSF